MEKITLETAKTGSELVLETLRDLGIDTIFGYPGGAVLPLYDAIYSFEGIQHILGRHEQGCLHEAEGYAKSTGKLGVAVVTSGPGATNAITGIADAMSDSVPLLVFTGQVNRAGIGKDAFQEADIVGITMPITKYNYQVRETADIPRIITEAVHIATTGRPGPVVIDLPKDVSALETDFIYEPSVKLPSYQPTIEPNELQIKKISSSCWWWGKLRWSGKRVDCSSRALSDSSSDQSVRSRNDCDQSSSFPRDGRNARILRSQYWYDRDRFHDQCWLSI